MKSILAGAVGLALVTVGTASAEAHPWFLPPLPGRAFVGGAVVGATVAAAATAPYYAYGAPTYPAPVGPYAYPYPVAGPVVVGAPAPYFYGGFRGGYGWGWGAGYHGYAGYRGYGGHGYGYGGHGWGGRGFHR
jgi:hypothetical protein